MAILKTIAQIAALIVFVLLGFWLSQKGFDQIQQFRQIERTSASKLGFTLEGEAKVSATVFTPQYSKTLTSPYLKKQVVYYRYLKEREERDSDGNTRWVTVTDTSRAVDFFIKDETGSAMVSADLDFSNIDWSMDPKRRVTQNGYRYTEWNISPDDTVWVFAWAEKSHGKLKLRFDREGQYTPIISRFDGEYERSQKGFFAVIFVWLGISCLSIAGFFLVWFLRIHRVLTYLTLITLINVITLFSYGFAMLQSDVSGAYKRLEKQAKSIEKPIAAVLSEEGLKVPAQWKSYGDLCGNKYLNLSEQNRTWVCQIQTGLYKNQQLYLKYISSFPENIVSFILMARDMPEIGQLNQQQKDLALAEIKQQKPTRINTFWGWLVLPVSLVIMFLLSWFGFKTIKVKRLIENVPTTASTGVTYGITEVMGVAELTGKEEVRGPISMLDCVWYHYLVKEKRGSGKNARWVTIEDRTEGQIFNCEDMEGKIQINPDGAEVITKHSYSRRSGNLHYKEWAIHPGDPIYALAKAHTPAERPDKLYLADSDELFILSNLREDEIMLKKATTGMILLNLAFCFLFGGFIFSAGASGSFSALTYIAAGFVAPVYLALIMAVLHYNDIIFLRERCSRGWANIQVSLKKRADLLPRLEKLAKAFMQHETHLQQELAALRSGVDEAMKNVEQAEKFLDIEQQAVDEFKLRAEAYPDIKAQQQMLDMHKKIENLETEIALIRRGYNDAVQHYNERLETFPDILLAKMFKFEPQQYLHHR